MYRATQRRVLLLIGIVKRIIGKTAAARLMQARLRSMAQPTPGGASGRKRRVLSVGFGCAGRFDDDERRQAIRWRPDDPRVLQLPHCRYVFGVVQSAGVGRRSARQRTELMRIQWREIGRRSTALGAQTSCRLASKPEPRDLNEGPVSDATAGSWNGANEGRGSRRHTALNVRFRDRPIGGPMTY